MGRPIKKRFFGVGTGSGLTGGEGVASLAVHGANSYSAGTTITFPTPPTGGSAATATISFVTPADGAPGNGNVSSVSLTSAGSGYLVRNATATFTKPGNVVVDGVTGVYGNVIKFSSGVTSGIYLGMVANAFFASTHLGNPTRVIAVNTTTGNVTFSMANTAAISSPISLGDVGRLGNVVATMNPAVTTGNTIQGNAFLATVDGGLGGRICDIVSQRSSRRYRVTNDEGTGTVRLVPTGLNGVNSPTVAAVTAAGGPVAAGQMTIQATDSDGGTYWVGKLESRTALLFPGGTGTPGSQFAANTHVTWTTNLAVASTSVKIATND
jgi:hypothetical protein